MPKFSPFLLGLFRAGNFLGQMNAFKAFTHSHLPKEQESAATWEAAYGSTPWGGYSELQGVQMITAHASLAPRTYTPQLQDTYDMLLTAGRSDWARRLLAVNGYAPRNPVLEADESADSKNDGHHPGRWRQVSKGLDRTAHPLVDAYCLYGTEVTTSYGFVFPAGILTTAPAETLYTTGDGNQDITDNRFCNVWAQDARPAARGYVFEATEFVNVTHMEMYSDPKVTDKVHQILLKYAAE